jgi:hypothetical protein
MPTLRVYTVVLTNFEVQFDSMKSVHSTVATAPPPVKQNDPIFSFVIQFLNALEETSVKI